MNDSGNTILNYVKMKRLQVLSCLVRQLNVGCLVDTEE